jgi:hypothetical protein
MVTPEGVGVEVAGTAKKKCQTKMNWMQNLITLSKARIINFIFIFLTFLIYLSKLMFDSLNNVTKLFVR